MPLRPKLLTGLEQQKRPIVILSNDRLDDLSGDTLIWKDIKFEDVYIIKGSGLNPNDLERARIQKAKAIIILSKVSTGQVVDNQQNMLDADAIFMYKTIKSICPQITIITELA